MKQYNPRTVLRQISNRLLMDLFEHHGHVIEADWEELGPRQVQEIYDAFLKLPERDRRAFEVELQDIHTVAQVDTGMRILVEKARFAKLDVEADLERFDSRYDKAAWMLLNHGDVWQAVAAVAHAENLQARSWHKRNGLPRRAPDLSPPVIQKLQGDISAFYWHAEGRGRLCHIEPLRRNAHQDYLFVYLSDHPDTEIIWDANGNWREFKRCQAFEVVFVYDRDLGTMDVYARGGHKVVASLQNLFAKAVLGITLPPEDPAACPYRLDGLKERTFAFDTDPEDGITQVAVRLLSVSPMGNSRKRITVQLPPEGNPDDIHSALERDLNHEQLPKSLLRVEKARICMKLQGYGRSRSLTFDISPRTCSLKSKPERLRQLGEKYLRRWGIEAA